jgi:CHASE3 domain sensor protein
MSDPIFGAFAIVLILQVALFILGIREIWQVAEQVDEVKEVLQELVLALEPSLEDKERG